MEYLAHKSEDNERKQPLKEHLIKTAELAEEFSLNKFSGAAYQAGLLHDVGKYQKTFQKRIDGEQVRIEHSICGAKEMFNLMIKYGAAALMLAYCIAGHHGGLPDGGSKADSDDMGTLLGRIKRKSEDYEEYKNEVDIDASELNKLNDYFLNLPQENDAQSQEFIYLTRYIFSCLTDADFLDTERFFKDTEREKIGFSFENALEKLNKKFDSFKAKTNIQKTRAVLQEQAYKNMDKNHNVFFLNMPTGSGKTLCSLKLSLETAIKCGKKRIIYVIPYTSIIEQTAGEFEKILGDSLPVLQHHSNYSFDPENNEVKDGDNVVSLLKATENWDAPLIVTTSVQFFQSLHSNKGSKLRKLHNMADSVIILDEAHLLPINYFQSCLNSLSFLSDTLDSKIILMSATLPNYEKLFERLAYKKISMCDLIRDKSDFKMFDKCSYSYLGKLSSEELTQRAADSGSALIVVNKRKTAKELYSLLSNTDKNVYHLSTYMTPYDRKLKIDEIRSRLEAKEKITVVSTSLIEAGVDLDFETVFRELSGLDSILQAGGRCNREGERKSGNVYIFELDDISNGDLAIRANITKGLLKKYDSISAPECIEEYYSILLDTEESKLTQGTILANSVFSIPFASYSGDFKIIDSDTVGIVVERNDESKGLIQNLKYNSSAKVRRKLQSYTATVYRNEFEELKQLGVINDFGTGVYCLTSKYYYSDDTGISFTANDSELIF